MSLKQERERRQGVSSEPFLVNDREDKYEEARKGISLGKESLSVIKQTKRSYEWPSFIHTNKDKIRFSRKQTVLKCFVELKVII